MASNEEIQQLISKAVVDTAFREQLLANPELAAHSLGIELSEDDRTRLKNLTPDVFEGTSNRVEERVTKMGIWLP